MIKRLTGADEVVDQALNDQQSRQMCLFLSKTYQLRLRGGCCEGRGPDPCTDRWSQDTWRQEVAQQRQEDKEVEYGHRACEQLSQDLQPANGLATTLPLSARVLLPGRER